MLLLLLLLLLLSVFAFYSELRTVQTIKQINPENLKGNSEMFSTLKSGIVGLMLLQLKFICFFLMNLIER